MSRYLLTPSLHDSWKWYNAMDSKEKQDFLDTLRKVQITDPDALERMERGKIFEADVHAFATKGHVRAGIDRESPMFACIQECADVVRGGLWQQKTMFDVRYFGMDFLVYGKIDVRRRDFIFDVKFTSKYEAGKFTGSVQHPTYMVGEKCKKFAYLVCDGDSFYREDYVLSRDMEQQMFADYEELVDGIFADAEFRAAYQANWKAYSEAQGIPRNDPGRNIFAG